MAAVGWLALLAAAATAAAPLLALTAVPPRCTAPLYRMQVLKYGAMSANIVTEEPIDMVLHESYPNR